MDCRELSDVEQAEKLSVRRARVMPMLAALFITQQASFALSESEHTVAAHSIDHVKFGAWAILSLVLLAALWSGGYWFHRREVRELLNDEVAREHRGRALSLGYLAAMLGAMALYVLDLVEPIGTRLALHAVVTLGIGLALVRFGLLERRAHRLG